MKSMSESARELGAELQRLVAAERGGQPSREWYADSLALQRRIRSDVEVCNVVSNFVWDWLSEVDVRRKAPEIAAEHSIAIRQVIELLGNGIWPD